MYSLRLFSKLPSPKKLAYEEYEGEEFGIGGDDGAESSAATPRLAFVTTRRETGSDDLSPPKPIHGNGGGHVNEFDLSPPKTIQRGRKRTPASIMGIGDTVSEAAKREQVAAHTPVRAAKRKTKLTWQSRQSPDKHKNPQHRRSPSLTRGQSDNSRLGSASDAAAIKSLRLSASFSEISGKESGLNNGKSGQLLDKEGVGNMPFTPLVLRKKPVNSELTSSINSIDSIISIATPRSASRSRNGSTSSTANPVGGTRATGAVGKGARALFQNQQAVHLTTNSQFQLDVDPTFWQDHSVQVLIRIRPINSSEAAQQGHGRCVKQETAHTLTWLGQPETRFTFDHVASDSISQEELFRVAGLPMVENCMAGYNSCMFAYGQTGSGKTHTMLGGISDLGHQPSDNRGMTPRVFESLFTKIKLAEEEQNHENLKFKCRCSFLEIYNEQIADLLEPSSSNLQMREDVNKGVYVEGLMEVEVHNVQDVLHLLLLGAANRRVAATNMNKESSRSHSVFTCIIESQWECDQMINFRFGRLNLVDLAGSERQRASGAEGERLKEASSINKSLSTLGLVIMVLVDTANGKQRHVPYRDSKLTFLLQDSLGGNSKTTIIANISPSSCASLETLSTLKFAQRAKFIRNNAIINEDTAGDMNGLRLQIQQLKDELARLRRQSISRIPTVRASEVFREEAIHEGSPTSSNEGLNSPIQGSFLHFGRTVQSPTVLNKKIQSLEAVLAGALRREQATESSVNRSAAEIEHLTRLVKQHEEETQCSKMILRFREDKIRRLEVLSDGAVSTDAYLEEEKDAALKELQLMRDEKACNPEVMRFAMENMRLQEQLRKFQDFHNGGEREAMTQEISDLRDQLVDVLDSKLSLDSLAHSQKDASAVELAAEKRQQELLRLEVESYRRDLEECRNSLTACLTSNDGMGRQLVGLRKELEYANEACGNYKKGLQDLQEKALEVDCLELKQAQHQQYLFQVKLQLRKSEEKAEEEAKMRIQLENQLKEALQESTNLQTELQWTKNSLDTTEVLMEKLQQNQLYPQVGVDQSREFELNQQAHIINQLQLELGEVKATLEDELVRGRGLKEQLVHYGKQEGRWLRTHESVESSESHDSEGRTRVKHHDAILQLQMELDTIDGAPESAIKSYRWEEGTRDTDETKDTEVKHSMTIMQLQLDLESAESALEMERKCVKKVEASRARLQKQLEETVEREAAAREDVAGLSRLLEEKEFEISTLQQDWENAAAKLIDYLAAGKFSFDAACSISIHELFTTSLLLGKNMTTDRMVCKVLEKQTAVTNLCKQLQDVRKLANSLASKLQELKKFALDDGQVYSSGTDVVIDEQDKESMLQAHQDSMALKVEVESCDAYIQEVESKSTMAFIMVWWLSETASLRCVDEDRIQERQGILFSLQLEHRKTPEKESRALQYKAQQELAALEDERKRLAAKNLRFEIQVGEIVNILEYLDVQIGTVKERLHRVNEKSSDVAKAQSSLTIVKVNWNLEVSSLVKATTEAEQRYTELKEELSVAKDELQRLEARTPAGETREYELQNERAKAEKELKEHLEAVQVLADDLRSQIELKEEENNKLKEQMAEQYEDWVLEKSELLVATQDSESRCIEKDQTITTLQRTMAKLQGQLSGAGHKPRVPKGKMYRLPEDEVDLQLEDRAEELKEAIDRLTAENLELRNEKLFFSKNTGKKIQMVAQKEEESSVMQKRLLDAEEHQKQAELKVQALTLLIEEFTCSQESWLSEKEFLKAEVERLQSCLENMNLEFQSCQKERDTCVKRLAQIEENKELLENHANNTPSNGVKNAHADLRKARAALASSEEKVKLLTDMVSSIGEDWAGERQNLISENEDLRVELARWEQHTDVRRSSDQPLRHLSENRSIPADASSYNKNVDKLRQDLEKMRTETANLRSRIREQDQAYLSVRMELSVSLAKRKDLEVELDRMAAGSQHLLLKDIDTREQIDGSSLEVSRQHAHIQSCESELERLTMLLLESEEQMNATKQAWREEKTRLEAGREEAQLEAIETRNEAGAMLVKFEEWKTTLREADAMVNALVRVNEKAKERWKREKEQLASTQIEETNKVVQEMLEAVALTKEQFEMTKGHAQGELCALISEIQILRLDMTHETLKLKREMPGNVHYNSGSVELLPSAKCLDSERRSWEHQIKAASLVLSHKETAIRMLQAEVEKCQKQTVDVQTLHSSTQLLLQEKEKMVLKLVNELNHLNQTMNRDRTLRQSLTRDVDNVTSLRRSFSCKVAEEKDSTLSVLKEEQEQLKTMVFNLEVENAELQQQLLEAEARSKALESTIDHLQRSDDRWFEKVQLLEEQLEESARHVSELESQRMELRDEMQRQAVTFAELHEQLQKQEGALEGEARAIANKVAAEKEVLHTLKEEKAELKSMVERLDAELTLYEKKASRAERSQAELERLELEMEGLQKELFRIESLQKEIEVQNAKLETMSFQSTKLEVDLASKNKELSVIVKELKATRVSADLATHECNELKCQVQELLEKASALEVEITRKRTAIKAVEAELLAVQETMARCLEDASIDLRELEIERDNLQVELSTLNEQLQATQALAEEQTAIAVEARQNSELSRTRAEEKQVEAEILGKSVVELESTVYALESQLGLVKRESERQRLIREDIEMELQGLKNHMSVLQAALEEAGARSTDDILEVQLAREEAERKLEEKDAEMQLVRKKLEKLQKDSEAKAEKIRLSKAQISDLLAEAERKAAKYEEKLKAVEIKLEERVNSQPTVSKGPKLKGAGSTFACIGMGHQVNSEFNAEQQMYERRIQELETDLSDQQREVCILNRKLGAAERMTREVLQDLLGVKSDMTNVASLLGQQQEEQNSLQSQKESSEKDEEVERLLQQLNEFIEERESWLEEISRRQSDLVAAQGAIDKMQERERVLCIENENIKGELRTQQKITGNLDQEVKNLSGQQNPQQRIKHHAKIKDENNLLRIQNDELSGKLRRAELLHARVGDELTKYRIAEGKTAILNFDEEQRLRTKVQELEEQKVDLSQNLANLCARIMETAGIVEPNRNGELAVALEALRQIKIRLDSTQIELEDCRLKIKIVEEKQRLNELRIVHSPMKGNFGVECLTPR